jgi:hypothetical protein
VLFGSGAAVVLRIILTVVAAKLLALPYLQIVGGLLLTDIAIDWNGLPVSEFTRARADLFGRSPNLRSLQRNDARRHPVARQSGRSRLLTRDQSGPAGYRPKRRTRHAGRARAWMT